MLERVCVWREGVLPHRPVGVHIGTSTMGEIWGFPEQLKSELPYDTSVPLLGVNLEKTVIPEDTRTPVSPAALFTGHGSSPDVPQQMNG